MSATRDNTQKVAFVYSNLYQIYQKGKAAAVEANVPMPEVSTAPIAVAKSTVLKTDDLHKPENSSVKISSYSPTELIGKRFARPASLPPVAPKSAVVPSQAVSSLKDNLKALNDLHSRLRFMLTELEDLVKKD
jgi:hypothetical protein